MDIENNIKLNVKKSRRHVDAIPCGGGAGRTGLWFDLGCKGVVDSYRDVSASKLFS